MVLQPVGPLPAATYWRRRLVLLLGVVVLLLLARSCAGGGGKPQAHTTTPTPSASPTATVAALATATPAPSPTARPVAAGTCPDSVLRVTATTDAKDYPVGTSPRFTVTVTNTSSTPCRRDLGAAAFEVVVSSGNDRVWSSDDCGGGTGSELLTLKAGASLQRTVTWSGKRSSKGCPTASPRPLAKPGYYRAVARVGTVRSAPAVFRLRSS